MNLNQATLSEDLRQLQERCQTLRAVHKDFANQTDVAQQARWAASCYVENSLFHLCGKGLEAIGCGPLRPHIFGAQPRPTVYIKVNQALGTTDVIPLPPATGEDEELRVARAHMLLVESGLGASSLLACTSVREDLETDTVVHGLKIQMRRLQNALRTPVTGHYATWLLIAARYLLQGAAEDLQSIFELPSAPRLTQGPNPIQVDVSTPQLGEINLADTPTEPASLSPILQAFQGHISLCPGERTGAILAASIEYELAELAFGLSRL